MPTHQGPAAAVGGLPWRGLSRLCGCEQPCWRQVGNGTLGFGWEMWVMKCGNCPPAVPPHGRDAVGNSGRRRLASQAGLAVSAKNL